MKSYLVKRVLIFAIALLLAVLSVVPIFASTYIVDGDWKYEITDSLHNEYFIAEYLGFASVVEVPSLFQTKPVVKINREAFLNKTSVTNVSIPKTVTEIGQNAFFGATSLMEVRIPSSVTTVGINAFYGCTAVKEVVFENNTALKSIPNSCFSGCSSIEKVTVSQGIEKIGSKAFRGCTKLSEITIPASVTDIADDAFKNCGEFTIHGWNDTYAQQFAADNNLSFVSLGDYIEPTQPETKPTQPETKPTQPETKPTDPAEDTTAVTVPVTSEPATSIPSTTVTMPVTTDNTEPSSTASGKTYIIGDSNLDGRISIQDATLVQKYAALLVQLDHIQLFLGNCDSVGDVNVKDATQIQKYCAGFDNILFVGSEVVINAAV